MENGKIGFVTTSEPTLLVEEMTLIVNSLKKKNHIYGWSYGTIGINEEENRLYVMEVDVEGCGGGDNLWRENDVNTFFSNYKLNEIRGY